MASTGIYKCKNKSCGADFTARTADRKRGWALFCSKSCKAKEQEKRTGQYANYVHNSINGTPSKKKTKKEKNTDILDESKAKYPNLFKNPNVMVVGEEHGNEWLYEDCGEDYYEDDF